MIDFIKGGIAKDDRGQIRFVNDFDISLVKRFYIIKNVDLTLVRGWRAHRIEQRWFYILSGSFAIDIVRIDDWETASTDLPVERLFLSTNENQVLHLSAGYATAFQSLEENSELLVFSDFGIENAPYDDYTYPLDYFINRK
ncbi:WxcM-like domain-containing protein [Sphingobacterium sp. UBA6320]|uniref:WxcM-like domain-containing protein n=1 Tax=Sphingobacterium sp. UBA6320 TaxID=1947510 RepID=UPI0025D4BF75|nr:WxcM-like domain-containing protein [Sphingobacterium sp. UBA6320]